MGTAPTLLLQAWKAAAFTGGPPVPVPRGLACPECLMHSFSDAQATEWTHLKWAAQRSSAYPRGVQLSCPLGPGPSQHPQRAPLPPSTLLLTVPNLLPVPTMHLFGTVPADGATWEPHGTRPSVWLPPRFTQFPSFAHTERFARLRAELRSVVWVHCPWLSSHPPPGAWSIVPGGCGGGRWQGPRCAGLCVR